MTFEFLYTRTTTRTREGPSPSSPPRNPTRDPACQNPQQKPISILFVDAYNQSRSILAQTQTSLFLLQTLNSGLPNPLTCIDSAGLYISSTLITPPTLRATNPLQTPPYRPLPPSAPADPAAIHTIFPHRGSHSRLSSEERGVLERMSMSRARGVQETDFELFDFIVAFEAADVEVLRSLQNFVISTHERSCYYQQRFTSNPGHARIVHLTDGDHATIRSPGLRVSRAEAAGVRLSADDIGDIYADAAVRVQDAVERFLMRDCGLSSPRYAIASPRTPFRSRQFVVRAGGVSEARLEHLRNVAGGEWEVWVDNEPVEGAGRLVTLTARMEVLREAVEIMEMYLGRGC
ncbi:hypothetical protein K432DRAFT_427303 [Lepidopterella palustris CBS 459.81]|uniref:Uncharacterized protein n=1 Tax=Lepidopterella palustris CBS 459.81 TaxID=1314670 RepID=A0A8E2JDG0_9PEZI|nr:hypothetical protein K432DRAFT_427303 [Lepidopterella palustris CBS 459.81]